MKNILTIIMLCGVCCGYAQNTPPYAASAKTWTVGNQIWSDHINVPACNKKDFDSGSESNPKADCRNNPDYYYMYSWLYVQQNAEKMCPAPWRIPTKEDFEELDKALGGNGDFNKDKALAVKYENRWGGVYGGYANIGLVYYTNFYANYWSSTEHNSSKGYYLNFLQDGRVYPHDHLTKRYGMLVRCVR
jgi:uncharacterized protein (TIGR02145 family)